MVTAIRVNGKKYSWGKKSDARKRNLIQITVWLPNNDEQNTFVRGEYDRVALDSERRYLIILYQNKIALYANDVGFRQNKIDNEE